MSQTKKTRSDELIGLRDAKLRERCLAIVARSDGQLEISDILRAALHEKLTKLEGADELCWRVKLDPVTKPGSSIVRHGHKPRPEAGDANSSQASSS